MGLIEKLQVLKMLDDMKNGLNQNRCENEVVFLEILKKKIEGLEGVKSESGWIPIGKYPSESSLLCFENGEMAVGLYDYDSEEWEIQFSSEDFACLDFHFDDEPIAWKPLPEPYYPTTPEKCNPHLIALFERVD